MRSTYPGIFACSPTERKGRNSPGRSTVRDKGRETTETNCEGWEIAFDAETQSHRERPRPPRRLRELLMVSALRIVRVEGRRRYRGAGLQHRVERRQDGQCGEGRKQQAADHG